MASKKAPKLHPWPIRTMHWLNAVMMVVMILSGWGIYNDNVIFSALVFPDWLKLGHWAQDSLLWHFAAMWFFGVNGLFYLGYGLVSGRFWRKLLPIRFKDLIATVRETLRLHLAHGDLTQYNAVQKLLYVVVILAGVSQVLTGLAIWKPVQFAWLTALFGGFQGARMVHFLGMSVIVGFLAVHVALAVLVPQTLWAMVTGGPPDGAPMTSPFRPNTPPDPAILDNHRPLVRAVERRLLLRGGLSLGLLTLLTGCDPESEPSVKAALLSMSAFNDRVQALLFDPNKLAPTYAPSQVLKPPRFNAYYDIKQVQPVDGDAWRLELSGLIADKRPWTTKTIAALPQREVIIRHVCVEGWDYIGQWSGVPLGTFLRLIGADLGARFIGFKCADNYSGSIDMATALHPQTLLATRYAGAPLADPFGFPLRLRTSTKLGFKNPKWITAMEVTNTNPGGYFENQGFNWFSGL